MDVGQGEVGALGAADAGVDQQVQDRPVAAGQEVAGALGDGVQDRLAFLEAERADLHLADLARVEVGHRVHVDFVFDDA